jgi:hypothetical protein
MGRTRLSAERRSPAAVWPSFSLEGDIAAVDQQIVAVTKEGTTSDKEGYRRQP